MPECRFFRWVDKEIRKLIELIKKHGTFCEGKWTILFGDLFKVCALEHWSTGEYD